MQQCEYSDLDHLIRGDKEAKQYFDSLPQYVKDSIRQRAQNVNTFEGLCDYAQNLTRNE